MEKLIVVIMGQDCERFIKMNIKSIKDADAVVFCDGGSKDKSQDIVIENTRKDREVIIIKNDYNQEDKAMNGKQRNFYLNYLKEFHPNDWALCIDADEVVEDIDKIKEFIQKAIPNLYSVKMRHFIGDLGHEDATQKEHYVLNRLFKISEARSYPEVEHPVLQNNDTKKVSAFTDCTTIWHIAYAPNMWELKKRYENHMKKSNMHTPEYLKNWYYSHLFGKYPKSEINPIEIPSIILNEFGIDKDEFYFQGRYLEVKHFIMMKQWVDYIKKELAMPIDYNPYILEYGAGLGPYGVAAKFANAIYSGIEISKYAIMFNPFKVDLIHGNIINTNTKKQPDMVLCIDVLEHLNNEELELALENIKEDCIFIFSIPFIGDPNLEADNTHKQFKTKEEWIKKFNDHEFEIREAPKDWLFNQQILIGYLKNGIYNRKMQMQQQSNNK
jgi:glycosyltransferase involved in cell wall biosynthesis